MDGRTQDLLTTDLQGESLGQVGTEGDDWANYYVGMYVGCHQQMKQLLTVYSSLHSFVDRDMFMRFLGIRIRHSSQHSIGAEAVVGKDETSSIDDDEIEDGSEDTDQDGENGDNIMMLDEEDEDTDSDND